MINPRIFMKLYPFSFFIFLREILIRFLNITSDVKLNFY